MKGNLERELKNTYEDVVYAIRMRKRGVFQPKLVVAIVKEILQLFETEANGDEEFILNIEKGIIKINGEKRMLMSCYWNYLNSHEREYFEELLQKYFFVKKPEEKSSKKKFKDKDWKISLKMPEM